MTPTLLRFFAAYASPDITQISYPIDVNADTDTVTIMLGPRGIFAKYNADNYVYHTIEVCTNYTLKWDTVNNMAWFNVAAENLYDLSSTARTASTTSRARRR